MDSYLPTLSRTLKMCIFSSNNLSKMPLFLIFFAEIFKELCQKTSTMKWVQNYVQLLNDFLILNYQN